MNVKAGDMALLIESMVPENVGKIVQVVRFVGDYRTFDSMVFKDGWEVEAMRPTLTNEGKVQLAACVPDSWLRPISGIPDTEEEHKEKELEK